MGRDKQCEQGSHLPGEQGWGETNSVNNEVLSSWEYVRDIHMIVLTHCYRFLADLMDSPGLIRNVTLCGHLHHGKVRRLVFVLS